MIPRAFLVVLVATAAIAHADGRDTSDAQRLFDEGRALLEAGKTDEACEKFELSIAKDPRAVGTLLNLGLCNERRGKVATALQLFQEAFDRAGEAGLPQHREAAQDHITKLVPTVPVLALRVAAEVAGQSVFVDDVGVKQQRELRLDPGPHKLVATAPGRLPFEKSFVLAASQRTTIDVPALERPKPSTIVEHASSRRLIGKVVAASGGGLLVGGAVMTTLAYRSYHRQFDNGNCTTVGHQDLCNDTGQDQATRARNTATGGLIIGVVGGVALAAGVVAWATAPDERRTRLVPSVSSSGATLSLVGRF
ncbi:MAG: tetratricopeptide repeat protein [Proteobacteria bacterium]|nr:tetratricopeptide repeat protein [Pseudomonadota bacterium]